jgi:hypothetical protein
MHLRLAAAAENNGYIIVPNYPLYLHTNVYQVSGLKKRTLVRVVILHR